MRDVDRLGGEVLNTLDGDPWYGSAVLRLLDGVVAGAAVAHPIASAHSIWELVLHMTSWTRETARRVNGRVEGIPVEGDFPPVTVTGGDAWTRAIDELRDAHKELAAALDAAGDGVLDRQVGSHVDAEGQPVTVRRTVVGLLQHDAYHAGQIALLKKAL
jgi:uncharacterized damage-inducible protein DinB